MARNKRFKQPFDKRGSVIAISRHLLDSAQFLSLSSQAKNLIFLLHIHWKPDKAVDYGIREAAEKIPCDRRTAMRAFRELENKGFISLIDHAWFSGRTDSRSRTWRLEWMPFNNKPPRNSWEKLSDE
jgi:hypothetical protein